MISPIYSVKNTGPLTITQAKTWVNVYGINCRVEFITFAIDGLVGMRIRFEPDPLSHNLVKGTRNTTRLFFRDVSENGTREVEQHINVYPTVAEVMPITDLRSLNDEEIAQFPKDIICYFRSVINYGRESIRSAFADKFRERACEFLDQCYSKKTEESISGVLSSLNYPLLFQHVAVPDNFIENLESIIGECDENLSYPLLYDGVLNVKILSPLSTHDNIGEYARRILQEEQRRKQQSKYKKAEQKAEALLLRVCGKDLYKEYKKERCITVEKDGWMFVLGKGYSILAYDEKGIGADLCVHTAGCGCHRIDEIVIAYLHIMHDCEDFLARSIVHNRHPNFNMKPFRRKIKKRRIINE